MWTKNDELRLTVLINSNLRAHEAFANLPSIEAACQEHELLLRPAMALQARLNGHNTPAGMENLSPGDVERLKAELGEASALLDAAAERRSIVLAAHASATSIAQAEIETLKKRRAIEAVAA